MYVDDRLIVFGGDHPNNMAMATTGMIVVATNLLILLDVFDGEFYNLSSFILSKTSISYKQSQPDIIMFTSIKSFRESA